MNCLVHSVLFKFYNNTTEEQKQKAHRIYQTLHEECGGKEAGILAWQVDWNVDQRKGWTLVQLGVFTDNDALQRYRLHPRHQEVAKFMSVISDWVIGDILVPAEDLKSL
ncbi:MAG: hypothetical protein A3D35_00215 [Candidatus Staskawiczbacteria bacterium RIFCSPHIGHO2_02_FULL_34_9]|uniref:Stress-response A/B barrel domain-containing protein n=1 Tax=Candidatus Staskawiczbacteria bacterium RIFCSPHIGHO2_02_FULL_34_9 TaxID=1802206 RepID=A0A1G2I5A4_9BACT|nr:MAG: hypothetical protein A3D35_00215 [Candidatus Staskawiczbacteria bacterium RIFCSPHIGHO2_02_FULL_34_9]